MTNVGSFFNWRRLFYDMRTEGAGRHAPSVGVGVFIGCLPIYGFHLLLVMVFGPLLRLNRLQMYVAAHISNPLMAPLLLLTEVQVGALVRRADLHSLTLEAVRNTSPWTFGGDLLAGSLIVGATLGLAAALLTCWATASARRGDKRFATLANRAANRYLATSITAWEFARAKMLWDPVYEDVTFGGVLGPGRALLDAGCGQGLMLSLLAEVRRDAADPQLGAPPVFGQLIGIEVRPRIAAIARAALAQDAEILHDNVVDVAIPAVDAVLAFDVLHMISADEQQSLVARFVSALEPGGVILVREADADGGWRFSLVRLGNQLKGIATGNWRQRLTFRTSAEWTALFERAGLTVGVCLVHRRMLFANVLFLMRKSSRATSGAQPI